MDLVRHKLLLENYFSQKAPKQFRVTGFSDPSSLGVLLANAQSDSMYNKTQFVITPNYSDAKIIFDWLKIHGCEDRAILLQDTEFTAFDDVYSPLTLIHSRIRALSSFHSNKIILAPIRTISRKFQRLSDFELNTVFLAKGKQLPANFLDLLQNIGYEMVP